MIEQSVDKSILVSLMHAFPVTVILGPRQSGKTTIAKAFDPDHYFDLENSRDLAMLEEPQVALEPLSGRIVIDAIQRAPNLFPLLRYLVDTYPPQRYLILCSASRDLIQQPSESLAERVAYHELDGFRLSDIGVNNWRDLWLRGGCHRHTPQTPSRRAYIWREQYVATFIERGIPQLGIAIPSATLLRFWTMLCHYHDQMLNHSELGRSFGISDMTVRRYLDILEGSFMVRLLQPWRVSTMPIGAIKDWWQYPEGKAINRTPAI